MKEKAIYFSFPSWHEKKICFKKLKCIPLSEYTDEVHVENIAGEEILELIMQHIRFLTCFTLQGLQDSELIIMKYKKNCYFLSHERKDIISSKWPL